MKTYFIDTNIFIYAQGAEHQYKEPCRLIMRLIAADEFYGVTNAEVLQEILYRYASIGQRKIGLKMVDNVLAIIHEVMPIEKPDIVMATKILEKYNNINVRDAIHAATAIRNNFKYILSVDKHFDKISGLQRINPSEI